MSTAASPARFDDRPIVIVMGVSGCGKSTVGAALARRLDLPFLDADDFHPQANVEKMSNGIPLTDDDRWPWLDALSRGMCEAVERNGGVIATCSALKKVYRDRLRDGVGRPLRLVLLDGDRDVILGRMQSRTDHYMPPSLLDSQFAALERPDPDEAAITISIEDEIDRIVDRVSAAIDRT